MRTGLRWFFVVCLCCVVSLALPAPAAARKHKPKAAKLTPPESALNAYIRRVRAQQAAEVRTPGSIWTPTGRRFVCMTW